MATDSPELKRSRRCCGCSLYTCLCIGCCIVLLIVAAIVVTAFLLYRQPHVTVQGVRLASTSQIPVFQPDPSSIGVNLTMAINIDNPNVVGANLRTIEASGQSPSLPDVDIANGEMSDVHIASKTNTTIDFPLTIKYSEKADPKRIALSDMLVRCGLTGKPKQKIPLKYKISVTVSVFGFISVPFPDYTSDTSFDCPISSGFSNEMIKKLIDQLRGAK